GRRLPPARPRPRAAIRGHAGVRARGRARHRRAPPGRPPRIGLRPAVDVAPPAAPLPALTDLALDGWDVLLEVPGARRFTPGVVRRWVLQKGARSWDDMTDLSRALRAELAARFRVRLGALERTHAS